MYFGSHTCITELIHVFQILHVYYGTYTCLTELILVLRSIYLSYGSYTCVTELILVFQILYLFYQYRSTRRYYGDFTCTKVPVGTTEQIQGYP